MKTFAERLSQLRKERDLSKVRLAEEIGISKSAITRYETGEMQPNLDVMVKIRDAFGVSLDWLAGFDENETDKYNPIVNECIKANISPEKLKQILKVLKD